MSECKWITCNRPEYKNGYCVNHNRLYGSNSAPVKKAAISQKSDKRKEQENEYLKLVKSMRKESNKCEIMIEGVCTGKMEGLHHKQKRTARNMCDPNNVLRSCNACNLWIEHHPLEAIEKGFSISKHKKQ